MIKLINKAQKGRPILKRIQRDLDMQPRLPLTDEDNKLLNQLEDLPVTINSRTSEYHKSSSDNSLTTRNGVTSFVYPNGVQSINITQSKKSKWDT